MVKANKHGQVKKIQHAFLFFLSDSVTMIPASAVTFKFILFLFKKNVCESVLLRI